MIRLNDQYYVRGTDYSWELLYWKEGKDALTASGKSINPKIMYFPTIEQVYDRMLELSIAGAETVDQMAGMLAQAKDEIREVIYERAATNDGEV